MAGLGSRGRRGGFGVSQERERDWPNDSAGHRRAARKGWRKPSRKRRGRKRVSGGRRGFSGYSFMGQTYTAKRRRSASRRDWPNDRRGHKKASKLGWKRRKRKGRRSSRDGGFESRSLRSHGRSSSYGREPYDRDAGYDRDSRRRRGRRRARRSGARRALASPFYARKMRFSRRRFRRGGFARRF